MNRVQYLQQLAYTTVRVALIGRAKKGLHVLRCPVFYQKYR